MDKELMGDDGQYVARERTGNREYAKGWQARSHLLVLSAAGSLQIHLVFLTDSCRLLLMLNSLLRFARPARPTAFESKPQAREVATVVDAVIGWRSASEVEQSEDELALIVEAIDNVAGDQVSLAKPGVVEAKVKRFNREPVNDSVSAKSCRRPKFL